MNRLFLPFAGSVALLIAGFLPVSALANTESGVGDLQAQNEPIPLGDGVTIRMGTPYDGLDLQVLTAENITVNQGQVNSLVRLGEEYAIFSLGIVSNAPGKIRVVAPDLLFRTSTEVGSDDAVVLPGAVTSVMFIAPDTGSGEIMILNEEDQVITIIPYSVRKTPGVAQSLSVRIGSAGNAGVTYNISQRQHPGQLGRWSVGVSGNMQLWQNGNTSFQSNEGQEFFRNVDLNIQYSW